MKLVVGATGQLGGLIAHTSSSTVTNCVCWFDLTPGISRSSK